MTSTNSNQVMTNTTYGVWEKIMRTHRSLPVVALGVVLLLGAVVLFYNEQPSPAADTATAAKLTAGTACDVTPGLAEGDQRWPAVTAGNGVYLVVWQDGEAMAGVKDTNIFAARVSADGKPLDPKAILVCTAKHYQAYPAVGFDGTNFIVAWQDYRSGKDWDLYAARVSPEGKVLDPDGLVIAAVPGNQVYPTLASDGKQCLLVWSDLRPQTDIPEAYGLWGTFLKDGRPAEDGGRELVPAYERKTKQVRSYLTPQVGHDGSSFVLGAQYSPATWVYAGPSLYRVSEDGKVQVIDGGFLGESFSLACDPVGKKAVVWSCNRTEHGHGQVVYLASLFSANNEQINHTAVDLQPNFGPANGLWCAVTHDGKNFVAVVEQTNEGGGNHDSLNVDLVATRIDAASGKLLETGSLAVPAQAWQDMRGSLRKAQQAMKGEAGLKVAGDPKVQERHPAIASLGDGASLLVYSRRGGVGQFKIHGVLLSE